MHKPASDADMSYWDTFVCCYRSEAHKHHINSICRPSKLSQPQAAAETDERCTTVENGIEACCHALGRNDDQCSTVHVHMTGLQRSFRTSTDSHWHTSLNTVGFFFLSLSLSSPSHTRWVNWEWHGTKGYIHIVYICCLSFDLFSKKIIALTDLLFTLCLQCFDIKDYVPLEEESM